MRDLPLTRPPRVSPALRLGNRRMCANYRRLREAAYQEGLEMFPRLSDTPEFREFVTMYIAEGYKRTRHEVSICNSDAAVMRLANRWITRLARNPVRYSVQFHADQDADALRSYWGAELGIPSSMIRLQRKSNSGRLAGRVWRCKYGVLTVAAGDTYLRARLQAWIDCLRNEWLDSFASGRSSVW